MVFRMRDISEKRDRLFRAKLEAKAVSLRWSPEDLLDMVFFNVASAGKDDNLADEP